MPEQPTSPPATTAPASTVAAGVAGAVAVAVSLSVSELVGALTGPGPSLVSAIGSHVVDLGAARFKNLAVSLFGTNDKPALLVGIVVLSLAIGAWLGLASRRRPQAGTVGIGAFALLGFAAATTSPQGSPIAAALAAAGGWVGGTLVLRWLLRIAAATRSDADPSAGSRSSTLRQQRRRLLTAAAGSGLVSVLALAVSRQLRAGQTVDVAREAVVLPTPSATVSVPPQPFAVPDLGPYVTPNAEFYRIDTALVTPEVDVAGWTLTVKGMVSRPFTLTYAELLAMPMVERVVTLSCVSNEVGGDLVGNARWLGVPLSAVLDKAG